MNLDNYKHVITFRLMRHTEGNPDRCILQTDDWNAINKCKNAYNQIALLEGTNRIYYIETQSLYLK